MPVVTPRLQLRPLQEGDGLALNEAKNKTWDQLTNVFQWASGTPDPKLDEAYVHRSYAYYTSLVTRSEILGIVDNPVLDDVILYLQLLRKGKSHQYQ